MLPYATYDMLKCCDMHMKLDLCTTDFRFLLHVYIRLHNLSIESNTGNYTVFFKRILFIRITRLKIVKKLRIS